MSEPRWPDPTPAWPIEAVRLCIVLWNDGRSASEITALLGRGHSRAAVCGKIHRLRGLGHVLRAVTPADKATKAPRPMAARKEPTARLPKYRVSPVNGRVYRFGEPKALPAASPIDASHAKPWIERAFGECAYPISGEGADTLSCCAPTSTTYCKAHRWVMFTKPQTPTSGLVRVARRFAA